MLNTESGIDHAVFVVESPNPNDVLDGRAEGEALSAALRLASITSHYFQVYNLITLRECFSRVAIATRTQTRIIPGQPPQQTTFVPHFHFSAHGNENGIALTSNEFLKWSDLRNLLIEFAKSTGRVNDNGVCLFPVSFSTCKGAFGRQMFSSELPQPCIAVVGPEQEVSWADSLTAYIVFYHLHICKDKTAQEAVALMNQASGLENVFSCYLYNQA